jgi:iron complex outermembrane receptor protein
LGNEIKQLTRFTDPNFPGVQFGGVAGGTGNTALINTVGFRPNTFFVHRQVYDRDGRAIENMFEDRNRDGVINERDRYRFRSAEPDAIIGITSNVSWGKWSAGFVMRGLVGNYMFNNVAASRSTSFTVFDPNGFLTNALYNIRNTGFTTNTVEQLLSDYWIENASFLRMDNINLAYNAGKVGKNMNLRITANVQNAFIITKYSGIDPEIAGGIDNNLYPRPRMFVLGVNLDF